MKYCLSPCIPRLKSQYSHSQLPLLANIFLYWLRELAIFSSIGFMSLGLCETQNFVMEGETVTFPFCHPGIKGGSKTQRASRSSPASCVNMYHMCHPCWAIFMLRQYTLGPQPSQTCVSPSPPLCWRPAPSCAIFSCIGSLRT